MASVPKRPTPTVRRSGPSEGGYNPYAKKSSTNWVLWTLLGIALVAGISVIAWRLNYQSNWQATDDKIVALLASADKLILENREDEAEAVARQGIGLLPDDNRCLNVIERINAKRDMIKQQKTAFSGSVMAQAEQLALTDIAGAIEALDKVVTDTTLTPEAQKAAKARIAELKGNVCSLRLPKDWPREAVLTLDDVTQQVVKEQVGGILPGKHTIKITRYGFSTPAPMELEFNGVDPLLLPKIVWKDRGAKVFVKSTPPGAAVWYQGKDTGKVTPFEIEDIDDGPVEFVLKHSKYPPVTVKGVIENRQPLLLNASLKP